MSESSAAMPKTSPTTDETAPTRDQTITGVGTTSPYTHHNRKHNHHENFNATSRTTIDPYFIEHDEEVRLLPGKEWEGGDR
jgi:hypothetical protein